ncbi:HNH endonuclease [Pelomonas sp. SE-A7]|uniref:HNH endonuclease n=1 Tax=Pelomonas sp. SE-A7 TaxID=3054953 RepID=UPI00338D9DFF
MPRPLDPVGTAQPHYQSDGARHHWITEAGTFHHTESSMPSKIPTLRTQAFVQQGGRCWYCCVRMWCASPIELASARHKGMASLKCTAEHLLAKSEGGKDQANNVVAACWHCNRTRHKRKLPPKPEAFRADVRRRVARGRWHHPWVRTLGLL